MAYQEFSSAHVSENTQQNLELKCATSPPLPAPFPAVVKLLPESQPEPKPSSVAQEHFSCWWDWIQISPCCSPFFPLLPMHGSGLHCLCVMLPVLGRAANMPGWDMEGFGQALPG